MNDDRLSTARGIVYGVVFSVAICVVVGVTGYVGWRWLG